MSDLGSNSAVTLAARGRLVIARERLPGGTSCWVDGASQRQSGWRQAWELGCGVMQYAAAGLPGFIRRFSMTFAAQIRSSAISTSGDGSVQAIAPQAGTNFTGVFLDPGTGASSGQFSLDNVSWNDFTAPNGAMLIRQANFTNGLWLRRVQGGSDLANVRVFAFAGSIL